MLCDSYSFHVRDIFGDLRMFCLSAVGLHIADGAAAQFLMRGEEELQFLGQMSRMNCSHSSFSVEREREREVTELDFIFYYFRFISIFPLSDERSSIWHVNPFSRVFL